MQVSRIKDKKKYTFDIKITTTPLDVTELKDIYSQLYQLKINIRKFTKDSLEHKFLSDCIKQLRNETTCYSFIVYTLFVKIGKNFRYQRFLNFPNKENINNLIDIVINNLHTKRQKIKLVKKENKVLAGIPYTTIGGTFNEEKTILKLEKTINNSSRIKEPKSPHVKIKTPYLGIELEIIAKTSKAEIESIMVANKLAGKVYLEHDGSIEAEEDNETPQEITLLVKQDESIDIVRKVCKLLMTDPINAYVNPTCGMHVHFDVRYRDPALVYKNLVHMLPLLNQLVPRSRVVGNWADRFCMQNPTDDILKAQQIITKHNTGKPRYQAINPMYNKHNTIEVRMHGGTINALKINNWIQLCLLAVESQKVIPIITTLKDLTDNFKVTQGMIKFLEERIALFKENPQGMDVRVDHFFFNKEA